MFSCINKQDNEKFVRLVKIKVDDNRVEEYIPILKKTNKYSNNTGTGCTKLSRSK